MRHMSPVDGAHGLRLNKKLWPRLDRVVIVFSACFYFWTEKNKLWMKWLGRPKKSVRTNEKNDDTRNLNLSLFLFSQTHFFFIRWMWIGLNVNKSTNYNGDGDGTLIVCRQNYKDRAALRYKTWRCAYWQKAQMNCASAFI